MQLKEKLSFIIKGSKTVTKYIQAIKCVVDDINAPIDDDGLMIIVLRGLELEFKEIRATLHTRETKFTFKELHDKLVEHKNFIMREEAQNYSTPVPTHYSHKSGQRKNKPR